jgi:tetratricopeptide (TPR) repeat protein
MSRIGKTLFILALAAPALAEAQRPSNTMHTTSALLDLKNAVQSNVPAEKQRLFAKALESAQKAVQTQAGNSKTWFVLGSVHAALGNAAAADSAFDKAEQLWPEYTKETETERLRAYVNASNAGVLAIQANDLAKATTALEGAALVYNKRPTALLNLGSLYSRQNKREEAIAAFRSALEILRSPARTGLKPEEEKQWAEWEEAISLNLAQLLALAEKNEEAVTAYQDYLKRKPDNTMIKSNLAVVLSRMGKRDEAAAVYRELLNADLSAEDFFRVGVGLRRAQQLDQAAEAFRKAIAKNPQSQESYFNLAYVLWETIQPLDDARSKATAADKVKMAAQLKPLYEQLMVNAIKSREFDPSNRNVLALMQRAYRGLADLTTDVKTANEYKLKVPPLITAYDALPFEVTGLVMTTVDKKTTVEGKIINVKTTKGQPMKIKLSLLNAAGAEIGSQEVSVTAPEVEAEADFKAEFTTDAAPAGWKYEILK